MGSALDHIVFATPDLDATVSWFRDVTGVDPSVGGPHLGMGTRNVLCALGDGAYLEIIGPDPGQPDPPAPRPFGIDDLDAHRVVSWCVRVDDIAGSVEAANGAGHDLVGPLAMSRQAPGGLLSWQLAVSGGAHTRGVFPFLIDWGDSVHPSANAASGLVLDACRLRHPDPATVDAVTAALGLDRSATAGPTEQIVVVLRGANGRLALPT